MRSIDVCVVARSVQSEVLAINHIDEASSAATIKIHFHTTPCVYARSTPTTCTAKARYYEAAAVDICLLPAGQSNSFRIYHHKQTLRQNPRNHKQSKQSLRKDPEITSKRGLLVSLTSWEYVTRPVVLSSLETQAIYQNKPLEITSNGRLLVYLGAY